ncbi:MAG: hypothetical protein P8130_10175 [Deltaproteobacteria bacterium]
MMQWFWLLVVSAVVAFVVLLVLSKRKKKKPVEKFVCDICHGTDCDCRRED